MLALLSLLALIGCVPAADVDPADPPVEAPVVPLTDLVTAATLLPHLEAFDAIGRANDGNRAWGTSGHAASVAYAVEKLTAAGFTVEVHTSEAGFWELEDSALEQVAPAPAVYSSGSDYLAFFYSAAGDVIAPVTAVDVLIPPGSDPNTSTSGCEPADFDGFPSGHIALLQRGGCTYATKVANAEAAGASGVFVFNEGPTGRTEVEYGTLDASAPPTIPGAFISYALGAAWVSQLESGPLTARIFVELADPTPLHNVIAERPGRDPARWLWVGAHLDSVPDGPGINDNASGSALVLALAEGVEEAGLTTEIGLRLSLWDGEEWGLLGSGALVAERGVDDTVAYLNFDMIGSPNGGTFVYDGDDSNEGLDFGSTLELVPGMDTLEGAFRDAFAVEGQAVSEVSRDVPTDSAVFLSAGLPVGGIFSGAFHPLTDDEAAAWGGVAGQPHDACYHLACDALFNLSEPLLDVHARAATTVIEALLRGELTLEVDPATRRAPGKLPRLTLPDGHEAAPWIDQPW